MNESDYVDCYQYARFTDIGSVGKGVGWTEVLYRTSCLADHLSLSPISRILLCETSFFLLPRLHRPSLLLR